MNLSEIWEKIKEKLKGILDEHSFDTWLSKLEPVEINEQTFIIKAPNVYFSNWFKKNCQKFVSEFLLENYNLSTNIQYIYAEKAPETQPQRSIPTTPVSRFNPKYTFENFVVGPNNRFAYSIAQVVAESPGTQYNPVFIYSSVGLGKTHLLHAIGNYMIKKGNDKVIYTSPEKFVSEFVEALQTSQMQNFRRKYSSISCLLIDDIHYLIGKESSQEEFYFIFNTLYDSRKQIVITSDRPPKDLLPSIQERLVTRFEWGVKADITPPDLETRIAILRKKSELLSADVPDDVIIFIAERIQTDVRKLEGALMNIIAYAQTTDEIPTIDMAKSILKDYLPTQEKPSITIEKIINVVSSHFRIPQSKLLSHCREQQLALARQIGMYLAKNYTDLTTVQIGKSFGNKTHPAVLHAIKKVKSLIQTNPQFANELNQIIHKLQS